MRRLFRTPLLALALAALAGVHSLPARAQPRIAVIVARKAHHPLSRDALRDIYLKKIYLDHTGHPYIPVNLPPDDPLRTAFSGDLFRLSNRQLQDYWNRRYFQGISPPYVLGSQQAVLQFVAKTPGAIGYVSACHLDHRVRALLFLPVPEAQRAAVASDCDRPRHAPSVR